MCRPVDIGAVDLGRAEIEREFTRFLAVTPEEFGRQRDEAAARLDPLTAAAALAPRPLLVVHGAGHDFAWERSYFRELVAGWLDEIRI
jgi:hypothetical protein